MKLSAAKDLDRTRDHWWWRPGRDRKVYEWEVLRQEPAPGPATPPAGHADAGTGPVPSADPGRR